MPRLCARAAVAALIAATAFAGSASAQTGRFEPLVESDAARWVHPVVDHLAGVTVWSETDGGTSEFHLTAMVDGERRRLPVAPRRNGPFDVDLGPDGRGGVVAAYSRCEGDPGRLSQRLGSRSYFALPYPPWTAMRGCDLYRFDFTTMRESGIAGASTTQASEMLPSIWRDEVAFARVYERRRGDRGEYPYLYVRRLSGDARSRRQPGGSRGVAALPGPTRLDLYGRRLSFVWNYATAYDRGRRHEGITELRLDTVGGGHEVVGQARWGTRQDRGIASYVGPQGAHGRLFYGFQRAAVGEGADTSLTSLLVRRRISTGKGELAGAPPGLLIDPSIDGSSAVAGVHPDNFQIGNPGRILRAPGLAWGG